jgi:hypothetical protein
LYSNHIKPKFNHKNSTVVIKRNLYGPIGDERKDFEDGWIA